jgi:pimeloyl-ACP methyl ester carboxylesterase
MTDQTIAAPAIDRDRLDALIRNDRTFAFQLRGLESARIRIETPDGDLDLVVSGGQPRGIEAAEGEADLRLAGLARVWEELRRNPPRPGFESLSLAGMSGIHAAGDLTTVLAPYHRAWERLYQLIGIALRGEVPRRDVSPEPFRDTDNAVGRYQWVTIAGTDYRVYYEQAGTGPVPLVLQHTAGCDGRQYRHMLADPELQQQFTMYAYDLPYHGRSLPPSSREWWSELYQPDLQWYVEAVVAFCDAVGIEKPIFMGCSVGGQLALDLAAFAPERFRGLVALNGWHHTEMPEGFTNDIFRHPAISDNFFSSACYGATAPIAPEANRRETYWIYRSNYPGVYAGDNDYFAFGHDLRRDGHLIDTNKVPLYAVAGEYDPSAHVDDAGGPEIARRIPGVKYVVLEGLSHFAPSDDPVGFNKAIMPILQELSA